AAGNPQLAHRDDVPGGSALEVGVGREAVLGLGDADRKVAVALLVQLPEPSAYRLIGDDVGRTIDLGRDCPHLFPERQLVRVEEGEAPAVEWPWRLAELRHALSQLGNTGRAVGPVPADDSIHPQLLAAELADELVLGLAVAGEVIERHDRRHPELANVGDVAGEVGPALAQGGPVLARPVFPGDAA